MSAPPAYSTKTDIVAEALRSEILGGSLPRGSQLRQDHVAARLGVSPTPVREAFGILEKEGFLERRPHRGVIVVDRGLEEVATAYELRALVESVAVRRVATFAGESEILELKRNVQQSAMALKARDTAAFRRATSGFHLSIARASRSDTLAEMVDALVARSLFYGLTAPQVMRTQQREHERILAHIRRHQPDAAIKALMAHMRSTVRELRLLPVRGSGPPPRQKTAAV